MMAEAWDMVTARWYMSPYTTVTVDITSLVIVVVVLVVVDSSCLTICTTTSNLLN